MSTRERHTPGYTLRLRKGGYYTRVTDGFDATEQREASVVSRHHAAQIIMNFPDGTLTVTPVAGKPLVR